MAADLAGKLQVKAGQRVYVHAAPEGFQFSLPHGAGNSADSTGADVVLAFVRMAAELADVAAPAIEAAKRDAIAYIAYPKAGQLGTDLNRDKLGQLVEPMGIRPVRQIAIDGVWSALRFRPRQDATPAVPHEAL